MAVIRIVSNIAGDDLGAAKKFYGEIFDMHLTMDLGWIQTYLATSACLAQVSVATEGGSGTAVPDLSIEVDNFEDVLRRLGEAGFAPEYGPVDEPWGVRRFYVRDPFGKLLNVLMHIG